VARRGMKQQGRVEGGYQCDGGGEGRIIIIIIIT